jgi:hypothetical protein
MMSYQTTIISFHKHVYLIYPDEFEIKDATESDLPVSHLDTLFDID